MWNHLEVKQIAKMVAMLTYLRAHPERSAHSCVATRQLLFEVAGNPKVHKTNLSISCEQHVVAFDVTVHHLVVVQVEQSLQKENFGASRLRKAPVDTGVSYCSFNFIEEAFSTE